MASRCWVCGLRRSVCLNVRLVEATRLGIESLKRMHATGAGMLSFIDTPLQLQRPFVSLLMVAGLVRT